MRDRSARNAASGDAVGLAIDHGVRRAGADKDGGGDNRRDSGPSA